MSEIEPRPQSSLRKDDDFDDLDRELETYIGQHEEQTSKEENVNVRNPWSKSLRFCFCFVIVFPFLMSSVKNWLLELRAVRNQEAWFSKFFVVYPNLSLYNWKCNDFLKKLNTS